MIIGSTIGMDALRTAVEDYWWPRIYSNQLSVELWDDNAPIRPPEPREREDLKPYLRCYSLIEEKMSPDEDERLGQAPTGVRLPCSAWPTGVEAAAPIG